MSLIRSLCCLMFAAAACQFPAFEDHYESRLSARLDESQKELALFDQAAQKSGRSLDSYIKFFQAREELEFIENAKVMQSTKNRTERLSLALERLKASPYPQKLITWVFHLDWELVKDTWNNHTVSFVLNTPTAVFALLGALIGYILCSSLAFMARRSLYRRAHKAH